MGSRQWNTPDAIRLLEDAQGVHLEKLRGQIRWHLQQHPDEKLRAAFAEHYQVRGVRSQAARWGIITPGWSSPDEVRELRHWLLGRFDGDDEVREMLCLPADHPLPGEVADLADPAFRTRGRERATGYGGCASFVVMVLLGLVASASAFYAAGLWLPRLGQPFANSGEMDRALASLVVLGASVLALAGAYLWYRLATHEEPAGPNTFQPAISPLFPTELAWSLIDQNDDRAATILLKALLSRGGDSQQARRALVQMSRDHARMDMAGRWGIAIGGLTTVDEQRCFGGAVRAGGGTEIVLRNLSIMRFDEPLTSEAGQILNWANETRDAKPSRPTRTSAPD